MQSKTPAQQMIKERGVPVGAALVLLFGAIGLYTDSTFAGMIAGAGLMLVLAGIAFRRRA